MIARRYISFVMTALVLACPFCDCGECCGTPVSCEESAGCDEAVCGCGCDRDAPRPCDDEGRDDSKKSDCFCNGAVLSDATHSRDHDEDRGLVAVIVMDNSLTRRFGSTQSGDPSLLQGSHFPPLLSGRDIRTLLESHLL